MKVSQQSEGPFRRPARLAQKRHFRLSRMTIALGILEAFSWSNILYVVTPLVLAAPLFWARATERESTFAEKETCGRCDSPDVLTRPHTDIHTLSALWVNVRYVILSPEAVRVFHPPLVITVLFIASRDSVRAEESQSQSMNITCNGRLTTCVFVWMCTRLRAKKGAQMYYV